MKKFSFVLLFIISLQASFAQYKKGLKYYERSDFQKAIPELKKVADSSDPEKIDACIKLADCYRHINDMKNAEFYYQTAVQSGKTDAVTHYNYGLALRTNNRPKEALEQFTIALQLDPNNVRIKNSINSFDKVTAMQALPQEYELVNVNEINTGESEFGALVHNNKFVFVSEQNPDIVGFNSRYDNTGKPLLNIYFTEIKNNAPSPGKKPFSKKINSTYHDGPLYFNTKQDTLYLTRVNGIINKKDKNFINRAKLYISALEGKHWGKMQSFPYNSDEYSVAHPSISVDGTTLFFSSDMPGGFGGMDIWLCKKNKTGWDKPVNLGAGINSSGNEEFPFIRKDGSLFFSSDGLSGFGGLDIFSCKQVEGKWTLSRNEGSGINSPEDDFSIFFIDNNTGYVSSNRFGGKGDDDIYKFTFTQRLITMEGTVLNSLDIFDPDPAKNIRLFLENEQGEHIGETRADEQGFFRFTNLVPEKKYMVKVDENDKSYRGQKYFYYVDTRNRIMRITTTNERGEKFVFRNLPVDSNSIAEITLPEYTNLAGNLLFGENPSSPIGNKQITLKDGNGNIVDQVITNEFGAFVFSKVPTDENFFLELDEADGALPPNAKIILTNKGGKQIKVLYADGKRKFKFLLISSDKSILNEMKVSDAELLMNIDGKLLDKDKKTVAGVKIYVSDENHNPLDTSVTDAGGKFHFKKLQPKQNYFFSINENDANLEGMDKLFLADSKGKIVRELIRNKLKGFSFSLLASEKNSLKQLYVDDPWLNVLALEKKKDKKENDHIIIVENIYYHLNAYKFDDIGQRVMDKVLQIIKNNPTIKIEISSHTDSRADDKFNLVLSQKRAKYSVDYLISHGINAKRLKSFGYGETRLINNCKNNVDCTEEQHAQNRRTEFKIISSAN